jgi:hypothetical protein
MRGLVFVFVPALLLPATGLPLRAQAPAEPPQLVCGAICKGCAYAAVKKPGSDWFRLFVAKLPDGKPQALPLEAYGSSQPNKWRIAQDHLWVIVQPPPGLFGRFTVDCFYRISLAGLQEGKVSIAPDPTDFSRPSNVINSFISSDDDPIRYELGAYLLEFPFKAHYDHLPLTPKTEERCFFFQLAAVPELSHYDPASLKSASADEPLESVMQMGQVLTTR